MGESGRDAPDPLGAPVVLTLGEATGLLAIAALGVLAAVSLALAQAGRHDGIVAVVTTGVVCLAGAAAVRRWSDVPAIRVDRVELGLIAAALVVAGALFLPGATYVYVDKDPGVYAAHAFAIARDGDVQIDDPVLAAGLDPPTYSGGRFPGLWLDEPDAVTVTSQFYHLQSALLATGHDLAGKLGVFQATPLLAVFSVLLLLLAARRAAGTATAVVATAILATCMLQVFQAKLPSSEVLAQLAFVGSVFAAIMTIELRWWPPAAISGALLPFGFLVRPDGVLYLLLGAAAAGVLLASGRRDAWLAAFIAGLLALSPYAFWNAYVERAVYTRSNEVPGATTVALLGIGALAGGLLVGRLRRRPAPLSIPRAWQRIAGRVLATGAVVALLGFWFRERLFGADSAVHPFTGERFATYDEDALHWLSWFLTIPGIVALGLGTVVLLVRPWRPALVTLVLPGALLLPLYLYDPRIASRLMWWGRRFVPATLPAIALLIGLAIAWGLSQRRSAAGRALAAVAAATAVYVVAFGASQSFDLRTHREMGGSWTMGTAVAANGTADGSLFLFERPTTSDVIQPSRNLPAALALIHDRATSVLSDPPSMVEIEEYETVMADREVLLVVQGDELPDELPANRFELRDRIEPSIAVWEESHVARPKVALKLHYTLTVWVLRSS